MTHLLSAFGGFLWIIPVLIAVGGVIWTRKALQGVKSGGTDGRPITFFETQYSKLAVGAWIAFVGVIIWMIVER